ncbi:MAG: hypothetical protein ACM30G_08660, partial [Micromonosporaceae bacterium]
MGDDTSDRASAPRRVADGRPSPTDRSVAAPIGSVPTAPGAAVGPAAPGQPAGPERSVLAAEAEPPAALLPTAQALFGTRLALAIAYAD